MGWISMKNHMDQSIKIWSVVMKQTSSNKTAMKKNIYDSDDENTRYMLNKEFFNSDKSISKVSKKEIGAESDDDNIRYKFPNVTSKIKPDERKQKAKPKIKVNFWSSKRNLVRTNKVDISKEFNRRHTIGGKAIEAKPKVTAVKVRKRVSFLPSPIFSENHIPMVTVPDDLTIQLNEEEANDLGEDLNNAFFKINDTAGTKSNDSSKRKTNPATNSSPKGAKRKHGSVDTDSRSQGNEYELEFFSKYVVQKLRRMETNQRIYAENLINTVLMLGQLGKLNGKSKISEA